VSEYEPAVPEEASADGGTNNVLSGAAGNVVQARDIHGGVHFHAASTAPPVPRQLPPDVPLFTGRGVYLAALDALFPQGTETEARALTLAVIDGTAGMGKSTLIRHWAHQHLDRFPDGQLWVDLRGFDPSGEPTSAELAVRGFLGALGVSPDLVPAGLDAQAGMYRSLVAGRRMLVVLDNARDTQQVIPLLPGGRNCTALVTSRRHLAGLVTAHGARRVQIDAFSQPEAREFLTCCLGAGRLDAEPDATAALLEFCGGLPLALSVMAARAAEHPGFPLSALAGELEESAARLDAVDSGEISGNLQAVLSWSFDALDPQAATMLRLLGIAPGPDISLSAAASLAALAASRARAVLRDLENASFIQQYVPDRYRMHNLIRLYAAERALRDQSQDDRDAALRRLTSFYLSTAYSADRLLVPHRQSIELVQPSTGIISHRLADRTAALGWFDAEHPCLLAAQDLCVSKDWHEETWQLAWALNSFHNFRGNRRDQIATWQASLPATEQLGRSDVQTLVLRTLGNACGRTGRYIEAADYLNQAVAVAEQSGDIAEEAHSHRALARTSVLQGNHQQGLLHASHAFRVYQILEKPAWEAEALNEMGLCQAHIGDLSQARASCEASLALAEQQGDREGVGYALDNLAYIAMQGSQHAEAVSWHERASALWDELDHRYNQAVNLDGLGRAHVALGHRDEARRAWEQALALYEAQQRFADVERIRQQLDMLSGLPEAAN
jgi:tetratricopeptide (TPR) repeat protein